MPIYDTKSIDRPTGAPPFERLASHYKDVDVTCPAWSCKDTGSWQVEFVERGVRFSHTYPTCGTTNEQHGRL